MLSILDKITFMVRFEARRQQDRLDSLTRRTRFDMPLCVEHSILGTLNWQLAKRRVYTSFSSG
jgi:hypothetical protein